jgi:regulator of ribonuclease activity B
MTNWPNDADGDVLRSMEESGFDFSMPCLIDFNVDFENWPPSPEAMRLLSREYPSAKIYDPEGDSAGYVLIQVHALLTYELVIRTQAYVSELMAPFKGECVSWGVLH